MFLNKRFKINHFFVEVGQFFISGFSYGKGIFDANRSCAFNDEFWFNRQHHAKQSFNL